MDFLVLLGLKCKCIVIIKQSVNIIFIKTYNLFCFSIDEVICLDDDDDDDVQIIEDHNISNVLKSKNNNNNKKKKNRYKNNKKVKSYTFYNCRTKNNSNKLVFSR